ncbi:MAG: hypothetical protein NW207_01005 [Cytophagales bacterium]|nr:hypothetical protein [Cytophagales bacterium]
MNNPVKILIWMMVGRKIVNTIKNQSWVCHCVKYTSMNDPKKQSIETQIRALNANIAANIKVLNSIELMNGL